MKLAREGASTLKQMALEGATIIVAQRTICETLEDTIRAAETGNQRDRKQAIKLLL